ncbi:hypothetical protein TSAR_001234 [Trichomalopsis sarcophagae]|uniref:Uncharacterized protein n=1 Tax=Trichomalopsis sarcophagae TaxID=543379 RepID=A0A232FGL4_9HYME|nr:hypothetical protein TSAR_001234 [Trichomalopsis sarcophagae]
MHANVNGLLTHFVEVEAYQHLNITHIIAITETKLSSHNGDASVAVDGYDLVRHERKGRGGGVVAVYIHKSLRSRILAKSDIRDGTSSEYVVLQVSSDRDKLLSRWCIRWLNLKPSILLSFFLCTGPQSPK